LKTTKEIESELTSDKWTQEKRKNIKEKLKHLGETDENIERLLISIESYCQLVLNSIR
jgi:hypothetical protein